MGLKKSFVHVPIECDFPIQNLPFGVMKPRQGEARVVIAIGEWALDLSLLYSEGLLTLEKPQTQNPFSSNSLNAFANLGRPQWLRTRAELTALLSEDNKTLRDNSELRTKAFYKLTDIELLCPFDVGGYTDFYASEAHASNVGRMFRGEENALMPNWKHIPIAYNGRASSVVVSGTAVHWPEGQIKKDKASPPTFGPSEKMDYELEVGFFIGKETTHGQVIPMNEVDDYIFGYVLVNDWSARDIQSWEYQPLGPFLGKSFATTISPWVLSPEALKEFRKDLPVQDPKPLPYLQGAQFAYDIELTAELSSEDVKQPYTLTKSNTKNMYWSFAQQLVHHASNGCKMKVGDLLASGTLSGKEPESWGCLLEQTFDGKTPLSLPNGSTRAFLKAGDEIIFKGFACTSEYRIGFGLAQGRLLPKISK